MLDAPERRVFETALRELIKMHGSSAHLPESSVSMFDVYLIVAENRFEMMSALFEDVDQSL